MLTGLLIFLFVVIALLAIPLALEFRVGWPNDARNEIVLVWARGLVRTAIPTGDPSNASKKGGARSGHKKRGRRKPVNFLAVIRQRTFRQRLYRFAKDLWHSITREELLVRARIGLGDPAETGQLWAIVGPVSGALAAVKGATIVIEPDFVDAAFEFDGSGRLSLIPLQVIVTLIGLLVSPAIWRGIRASRAS